MYLNLNSAFIPHAGQVTNSAIFMVSICAPASQRHLRQFTDELAVCATYEREKCRDKKRITIRRGAGGALYACGRGKYG